ncbi:MAG: GIY-YIG nuclease family protein [Acaryochloris sp. RU_4_1]|nr:GIY-YIG nuclease family protein [Acaryochloris sp. SU_5_25]NJM66456.1 GIY-YIG nuclease family protein [Acaryochloris sp. RU_4_1]NJR55090.1 GIY-YIG nuclease family protein [Acaryochloris sp. CRU_2_0]
MSIDNPTAIEHQNVPQEHQGLHNFLYGSEDEHTAAVTTLLTASATASPIPISVWIEEAGEAKIAGVYAVFDQANTPHYIGYSRNVSLSLKSHLTQHGEEICALVKVQPFTFPKRAEMEQLRDEWIAALPSPPPGNTNGSSEWAGTLKDAAVQAMSVEERQAYEDKKVKLQKAMALGVAQTGSSQSQSEAERRQNLESAIKDDNWSAVIREQTQETRPQ